MENISSDLQLKPDAPVESKRERWMRLGVAIFYENNKGKWVLSLGRISWWITLLPALYIWILKFGVNDITDHHMELLYILAAYNLGKRGLEIFNNKKSDGPPA